MENLSIAIRLSGFHGIQARRNVERTPQELGSGESDDEKVMIDRARELSLSRLADPIQKEKRRGSLGEISAAAMEINGVPHLLCITRDLSWIKAAKNAFEYLLLRSADRLAQSPHVAGQVARTFSRRLPDGHLKAFLMIELDNFKTLNDTLGHQKSDLLLRKLPGASPPVFTKPAPRTAGRDKLS